MRREGEPHPLMCEAIDGIEKEMDAFLAQDNLDPEYIVRERLHIILHEALGSCASHSSGKREQRIADAIKELDNFYDNMKRSRDCSDWCKEFDVVPFTDVDFLYSEAKQAITLLKEGGK